MTRITHAEQFGKVAVLLGGDSGEREVSLQSGAAVLAALLSRGVDAHAFDPAEQDFKAFLAADFDRAFVALHGGGGEDGRVQGALEWAGIAYTGTGVAGSSLAMDKVRSKQLLAAAGLPVIGGVSVTLDDTSLATELPLPLFVKPANGGSSLGAGPVLTAVELQPAIERAARHHSLVLVEPLLCGPEYTVAVLHGQALPPIRIEVESEFYDYEAKYVSDATRFICPGIEPTDPLAARLARLATESFRVLGGAGWGRVDFIMGQDGEPHVLEINTVPGMTSHSLVPCAAAAAGIDFATLCWRILETSVVDPQTGERHGC